MENFKEIAEKCLAGELSGRFVCRDGLHISSFTLSRTDNPSYPYKLYRVGKLNEEGLTPNKHSYNDIIQFIPYEEMTQEQIKIDIPEGKIPVMESTESGVVITWKEKAETYADVESQLKGLPIVDKYINVDKLKEGRSKNFYKKVEVLRKLTNIRNYFGKCDKTKHGYHICQDINHYDYSYKFIVKEFCTCDPHEVVFDKKEHAEQAIKMLGDELKYLFEPW